MNRFEPIADRARWRCLYDLLLHAELDETVTYEEMGEALGLHPRKDRHAIQMAFRRAAKEYEQQDSHAVEAIPNVGYRVVEPDEQLRLARQHQRKAGKSLERGQSKVVNVDLNGMDPEIRRGFEITARVFSTLLDYNRRLEGRQDRIEAALDSMVERSGRTDEEIAALQARLAALEDRDDPA